MNTSHPNPAFVDAMTQSRERMRRLITPPPPVPHAASLNRALALMLSPHGLGPGGSPESDLAHVMAEADGEAFNPHRIRWPLRMLGTQRDLNVANATQGGFLVGQNLAEPVLPLLPWSVALQGGAMVWTGLQGDVPGPRVTALPTAVWLGGETASATESNATFGTYVMKPKAVSAYVEVSRHLLLQGTRTEDTVRSMLARVAGAALDRAVFNGSGSSGEPLGVLNTAGIGSATAAGLNWAGICTMRASVVGAAVSDRRLAWVGGINTQTVLSQRERASGSGKFIWDDLAIGGIPAYPTSSMTTSGLMLGDWEALVIGIWGNSIEVEVNPFAQFQAGIVGFRIILNCDVNVVFPAYFSAVTGVS